MKTLDTDIPGVLLVDTERRRDARGGFARWFCENDLADALQGATIRQINHSLTAQRGSVRGMHFQYPPHAEKKIIRCLAGKVFDVVVDLRCGSPTFLAWRAFELAAGDDRALLIPEGCAHGFQTLTEDAQLLYLHSACYTPAAEGGVRFDDPQIAVAWPLPPQNVSERDAQHPFLPPHYSGITL